MTSPLLTVFRFANGVTAKNRLWLAPMTNLQSADDGSLSDDELHWLVTRATGGFGVIETCASHVAEDGQAWRGELGVFADRLLPGLHRWPRGSRSTGHWDWCSCSTVASARIRS